MTKPKYSSDKKCKYFDKSHTYKVGKKQLTSCTTVLKDYFSPFDADRIAKFKAMQSKRQGIKGQGVRYWKAQWKKAADDGTKIHELMEETFYAYMDAPYLITTPAGLDEKGVNKAAKGGQWLCIYLDDNDVATATPEYIVYDEELGIAGQVDLLVFTVNENNEEVIDVIDWKSNKKMTKEGYRGAMAKDPISHMPDCLISKYTLQLSMYAYMLERKGYVIGKLLMPHLKEDGVELYEIDYAKEDIENIIKWRQL